MGGSKSAKGGPNPLADMDRVGPNPRGVQIRCDIGTPIDINNHLKILGICLDNNLSFREHISIVLKNVYSKIGALRRLKRLVPANTMLLLYKSFVLSHFEHCNSLLMGIGKTLKMKLENANYYGLRTIMNMRKSTDYESILRMADMNTLEHRRIEQSLIIFFKCFKENGPGYVTNLFKPRVTPYNLRSNDLNVVQTSYNSIDSFMVHIRT